MDAQSLKTKVEKLLLDNGSKLPDTLITTVIEENSIKILEILVDLNIDLNVLHDGQTFLHLCCKPAEKAPPEESFDTRRCELIRFLIAKGANDNAKNKDGRTPLAYALRNKYFAVVKFLVLNYDVDVNFEHWYDGAPLHNLMRNYKFHIEDENLLARFLELGFNINSQDNYGNSILHYACIYQEAGVIEFLIRNGVDVNLKNSDNYSPLHFVLSNSLTINHNRNSEIGRQNSSTLQVIQVLLRYNADVNAVDKSKRTALYYACCEGIVEAVQLLLKSGANPNVFDMNKYDPIGWTYFTPEIIKCLVDNNVNVNARNNKNETILHIACTYSNVEVVKLLLENGADPNVINTQGITPTMKAVDNLPMVKHLLDYNADVNMVDNRNKTALHYACKEGNVEVVQLLLENGANPNALDIDQYTPIMGAGNSLEIIKCLVDYNANVNAKNNRNETVLYIACNHGEVEVVKFLLENGADPNVIDTQGITPTMKAVDNLPMVKDLLDYNADVNVVNNSNETALHYACICGNVKVVQLLLESGANPNGFDIDKYTSIMGAFHTLEIIKCLVDNNVSVNARNNKNETILHIACNYGNVEVVKLLLENGADPNVIDTEGITPTMKAIDNLPIVKHLLDYNADVDMVDNRNKTALHYACIYGNVKVVQLLLESGANPNVPDIYKLTPIMGSYDSLTIIKCLVDYNANVNARNDRNETVLHFACDYDEVEVVKFLLENGADPNVIDFEGFTPILRAARHLPMSSKVVKCLLDSNAHVNAQNNDGETLLHFASQYGCVDIVRFVLHRHIDLIYINNKFGRTALHLTNSAGNHEIMEILLDYGADTQKRDKDGIIPMINVDTLNRYIIKMKCVGRVLKINPELYNKPIYNDDDDGGQSNKFIRFNVNDFKAKCNAEIEAMKITEVGDSNVTLYDLLMNGYRGIVANIFGYEKLMTILQYNLYRYRFPLYIDIVSATVAESGMRRKLLKTAEKCVFTGIFKNLPYDCVREILGYLNVREIKLFLNAQRLEDVEEN